MSIDRSLRTKSSLERHRNVLTRAERVARLIEQEQWTEDRSPLALPKIAHRKAKIGINPKTGQKISIKAKNVPVFRAGKALKDRVK